MHAPHLQQEALRSLHRLSGRWPGKDVRRSLFTRSPHVQAQQRRTFQYSIGLGSSTTSPESNSNHTPSPFTSGSLPPAASFSAKNHDDLSTAHDRIVRSQQQTARSDDIEEDKADDESLRGVKNNVVEEQEESFANEIGEDGSQQEQSQPAAGARRRPEAPRWQHPDFAEPFSSIDEATTAVQGALSQNQPPHLALQVFVRAARTDGYLQSVNETALRTIWDYVKPDVVLAPFRNVHRALHPRVLAYYQHRSLRGIYESYTKCAELILDATDEKAKGKRWRLQKMLEVARVTGDAALASRILEHTRRLPTNYKPTLGMYNSYLTALCWDGADTRENRSYRVTPWSLKLRKESQEQPSWQGYRIGPGGLKDQVLSTVKQMQSEGLQADTETWQNVVIALAREADLAGVKSLIQRIWDVDVAAVLKNDERGLLFENRLLHGSSLFPDEDTLFAIAHAFSINNEVFAGTQVVEFISRKYNVPISKAVWTELLEWAFVMSKNRYGHDVERIESLRMGQLPPSAVMALWDTMSSAPYYVRPTSRTLLFLTKTAQQRGHIRQALDFYLQAISLGKASRRRANKAMAALEAQGEGISLATELYDLQRIRDLGVAEILLRTLLRTRESRLPDRSSFLVWYMRIIPDLLARSHLVRGRSGHAYTISNGRVHIHPRNSTVRLERGSNDGSTVMQVFLSPPLTSGEPWLGLTRQQRLQDRYAKETEQGRPKPAYQPQWFEVDEIKDWHPLPRA